MKQESFGEEWENPAVPKEIREAAERLRTHRKTRMDAAEAERSAETELLELIEECGDPDIERGFEVVALGERVLISVGETKRKIKTKKLENIEEE